MIDVIIPTCKKRPEVASLVGEVRQTAACPVCVIATCLDACAARNRNAGLDLATSPIRIMIDDDVTGFPRSWVTRMVEVMLAWPDCVMLTPELLNPDGTAGPMMGAPPRGGTGVEVVPSQKLVTACIAIRKNGIRFDEQFVGSGFEDDDYSAQLRRAYPNGVWLIDHDLKVVHRNEMKNQSEPFQRNREYFERKWGVKW